MVNNGLFDYSGCTGTFPSGNFTVNGGTLAFGTLTNDDGRRQRAHPGRRHD